MMNTSPRGFTLLIALIFTAVILSVGLSLMDVAYKQVILASTARQSQYAFYNADSAMECALEQDQVSDTFDYSSANLSGSFACEGNTSITYTWPPASLGIRTTYAPPGSTYTFAMPCPGGGSGNIADVTVYKTSAGATKIFANGYSSCNANDPQRVQRGLKSSY